MLFLRIRQAEVALKDGRLDEAYEQAKSADFCRHRHGQRLITRLVERYIERIEAHLAAGTFHQALADADRADRLAGNQPRITQLRHAAQRGLEKEYKNEHARQHQLKTAQRLLAQGEFSISEKCMGTLDNTDWSADQLRQEAVRMRQSVESALARADRALANGQIITAIEAAAEIGTGPAQRAEVQQMLAQIMNGAIQWVRDHLEAGRLQQAQLVCRQLHSLPTCIDAFPALTQLLGQLEMAAAEIRALRFHEALPLLIRLRQEIPTAKWLEQAVEQTGRAAEAIDALKAGPLALLTELRAPNRPHRPSHRLSDTCDMPMQRPSWLPTRFMLHVDGAGSFLVLRQAAVTFSVPSRTQSSDVVLQGHTRLPRIVIERVDDDYFVRADEPIELNDRGVTSALLSHGDKVNYGQRGVVRFWLPNPASTSAVLELLPGTRWMHGTARRVIMMDDTFILAPHVAAHIVQPQLPESIVAHVSHERLHFRAAADPAGSVAVLEKPLEVGGIKVVIVPVS